MESILTSKWGWGGHSGPPADSESAMYYHHFLLDTGSLTCLSALLSVFGTSHVLAEMLLPGSSVHIFQKLGEIKLNTETIKQIY